MKYQQPLAWILFITVWVSNINNLIRGEWFFKSTGQILFWNFMGLLGFMLIVLCYREEIKNCSLNTGLKSKEEYNG